MNLENLISEFLLSLDNYDDEEYYMTNREHATKWLEMFMRFMKKKYVSYIGANWIEIPSERLEILY